MGGMGMLPLDGATVGRADHPFPVVLWIRAITEHSVLCAVMQGTQISQLLAQESGEISWTADVMGCLGNGDKARLGNNVHLSASMITSRILLVIYVKKGWSGAS